MNTPSRIPRPSIPVRTVPVPAETLDTLVKEVRQLNANITVIGEEARITNQRIGVVETRVTDLENRADTNSDHVKSSESIDVRHEKAIAELGQKVDRLLDVTSKLHAVAANPTVRKVAYAIGSAVIVWLTAKGYLTK